MTVTPESAAEELITSSRGPVAQLTLNRPERRNALTPELIDRMIAELDEVTRENHARAVVIAGAAPAFCAGFDISMIASQGGPRAGAERDHVERLCERIREVPFPVLAKIDGVVSGAGCDLALACDLRFSSNRARFSMPPAKLGLLNGLGGITRLVSAIGPSAAKELLFTGEQIDAERALRIGLVDRLAPEGALDGLVDSFLDRVVENAPLTIAAAKLAVDLVATGSGLPNDALARIKAADERVWNSADAREGPEAFRERRPPRFVGS